MYINAVQKLIVTFVALISVEMNVSILAAAASPQPELRKIVGHWACVDRDTDGNVFYFRSDNLVYGGWLRLDATFSSAIDQKPLTAVTFIGFDARRHRWIISAVQSSGNYYIRSSSSGHLNGSQWIDAYPADGGTAVLAISGPTQYSFDFSQRNGQKEFKADAVCRKA